MLRLVYLPIPEPAFSNLCYFVRKYNWEETSLCKIITDTKISSCHLCLDYEQKLELGLHIKNLFHSVENVILSYTP